MLISNSQLLLLITELYHLVVLQKHRLRLRLHRKFHIVFHLDYCLHRRLRLRRHHLRLHLLLIFLDNHYYQILSSFLQHYLLVLH